MKTNSNLTPFRGLIAALILLTGHFSPATAQPACTPSPSGLVSWWRAENSARDAAGANHGTLQNGATFASGKVGQAFSFDGVNDFLEDTNALHPQGNSPLTIEFWMKAPPGGPSEERVMELGAPMPHQGVLVGEQSGNNHIRFIAIASVECESTTAVFDDQWHHVAAVYDLSNLIIYVDGHLENSLPYSSLNLTGSQITIGQQGVGYRNAPNFFAGLLDEVAVYSRALSVAEIATIYQAGATGKCPLPPPTCVPPPSGLVSWWRAENNANDAVGLNNGTFQNGATFAAGKVGQAFSLDGVDDYISVPNLDRNTFTFVAWFKRDRIGVQAFEGLCVAVSDGGWGVYFKDDDTIGLTQVGISQVASAARMVDTSGWHHVAVTFNGSEARFYIDGTFDAIRPYAPTFNSGSGAYTLGSRGSIALFQGLLDEVAIFNRVLSSAEVQSIFNAGSSGICPAPPTPTCPANVVVETTNLAGQVVTFAPTVSNTDGAVTVVCTPPSGSVFPIGMNAVNCTATDVANQSVSCGFTVTVNQRTCAPQPFDLVSWWRAEDNGQDAAGANHGSLANGVAFAEGKVGKGILLDGVNDFVEVPNSPSLNPANQITIEAWYKPTQSFHGNGNNSIVDKGFTSHSPPYYQYHLGVAGDQFPLRPASFSFSLAAGGDFSSPASSEGTWSVGNWYHLVGTYDGSAIKLYVNGALASSAPRTGQMTDYGKNLRIGGFGNLDATTPGLIDEVSLYHRALTAQEISALYEAGSAGKCTPAPPTITCPANISEQTLVVAGKAVEFNVEASNPDGNVLVVCAPASGSLFPLGVTTVQCTATSGGNAVSCSFVVIVSLSPDSPFAYFTDFESGLGAEWSNPRRIQATSFSWFSGQFGNESQTLTLHNLIPHKSYVLEFDLYVLDSWDGSGSPGPDYFDVLVNGVPKFHETFSNYNGDPPDKPQSYPGSPEGGRRHLGFNNSYVDAIYRRIQVPFIFGGESLTITFVGSGLQSADDESWGIDNVTIKKVPLQISPVAARTYPGETVVFTASGGTLPPYTFSILNPPAHGSTNLGPATLTYLAGHQCGVTDTIQLTDAEGTVVTATVQIEDVLPPVFVPPTDIIAECAGLSGTVVTFTLVATDNCAGAPAITCIPPSNSLFPPGFTRVDCTATDASGNTAMSSFQLEVRDATPPAMTCPTDMVLECTGNGRAVATFTASAMDACDENPRTTCSPASGSTFTVGTWSVLCQAEDTSGNKSQCLFNVTVRDTTPPQIFGCPGDTSVPAGFACKAPLPDLTGGVVAIDACGTPRITQSPAPGTLVGLGSHAVTLTAMDDAGLTAQCVATVSVRDATAPGVSCFQRRVLAAGPDCTGTIPDVRDEVMVFEECGSVTKSQNPPAGSIVEMGQHTVEVTVTDEAGLATRCSETITIRDLTPPIILSCPPDRFLEAGANCRALLPDLRSGVVASDLCGAVILTQDPPPGVGRGLGAHLVTFTATDSQGNAAMCSAEITIRDTIPPVITAHPPDEVTLVTEQGCFARLPDFTTQTTATDVCGPVRIQQSYPAGSLLPPVNLFPVFVTVADSAGNTAHFFIRVRVVKGPPLIELCASVQSLAANADGSALLPDLTRFGLAVDWCPSLILPLLQSPAPGTRLAIGAHIVTFTATAADGRMASCTALVDVQYRRHTLSGRILRSDRVTGLGSVPVRLNYVLNSRLTQRLTHTDSNGRFTFRDVPRGSSGAVYPSSSHYRFTPASWSISNLNTDRNRDFLGYPIIRLPAPDAGFLPAGDEPPLGEVPFISGLLLDTNGLPLGGIQMELSGDSQGTTNTTAEGEFLFDALPQDGTFLVTPHDGARRFAPPALSVTQLSGAEFAMFIEQPLEPPAMPQPAIRSDLRFEGQLTVTWPGRALDYVLEASPSLSEPLWEPVTEQQLQDVGQVVVLLGPPFGQRYFRLRSP